MVFAGVLLAVLSLLASAYCLLELVTSRREDVRTLPKPAWFVALLVPVLGPAAWYLAGRPAAGSGRVLPDGAPPASRPDDDEEFLRELRRRADEQRRQAERQREQDDEDRSA